MLLTDLKSYIQSQRLVSLFELGARFNLEPEILRSMLQLLIKKGRLQQRPKTNSCGLKCSKCNPLVTEIYEWID